MQFQQDRTSGNKKVMAFEKVISDIARLTREGHVCIDGATSLQRRYLPKPYVIGKLSISKK